MRIPDRDFYIFERWLVLIICRLGIARKSRDQVRHKVTGGRVGKAHPTKGLGGHHRGLNPKTD